MLAGGGWVMNISAVYAVQFLILSPPILMIASRATFTTTQQRGLGFLMLILRLLIRAKQFPQYAPPSVDSASLSYAPPNSLSL